jgi:hypothetical protein
MRSMKRPIAIYVVAAWCFFALVYQTGALTDRLKSHLPAGQIPESLWSSLRSLIFILVVWHIVRLVQLKAFNRWFSIVFFLLWTAMMTGNFVFIFLTLYDRMHNPLRILLVAVTLGALNVSSACYLARRRFREFAVQFVAERESLRHSQMMQRVSKKQLAKEAGSRSRL